MRDDIRWRRFLVTVVVVFAVSLSATALAIATIDPLGVSPLRLVSDRYLPQTNRRYIVPAIVRSGRYDSYVVGTSTVHPFEPQRLSKALGGRFANLSLFGATPYEQAAAVHMLARTKPATIFWGLDVNDWCAQQALPAYHAHVGKFPDWLYDASPWNDWLHLLNAGVLDLARRKLLAIWWARHNQPRADGYQRIRPPDHVFDVEKARARIYGNGRRAQSRRPPEHGAPEYGARLPGVGLFADALGPLSPTVKIVVLFMPVHAAHLPDPRDADDIRIANCKAAIAGIVGTRDGMALDAAWPSAWTVVDHNFWDNVHFRDGIADEIIDALEAVRNGDHSAWSTKLVVSTRRQGRGGRH